MVLRMWICIFTNQIDWIEVLQCTKYVGSPEKQLVWILPGHSSVTKIADFMEHLLEGSGDLSWSPSRMGSLRTSKDPC